MIISRLKVTLAILVASLLVGCGPSEPLPPVEILHARFGIFTKSPDGKNAFSETKSVPLKVGQAYGWIIYLRTNKPSVRAIEKIKLAAPTEWGLPEGIGTVTAISSDKSSASVERIWSKNPELIFGKWVVSVEDPQGPASITVNIEGVEQRFDFNLAR
jgi:hypothetical protein